MFLAGDLFRSDTLSRFIGIFVVFFSFLIALYALGFMTSRKKRGLCLVGVVLTMVASLGVVFADNLFLFIVCWGFLGVLLYFLIEIGEGKNKPATAQKTLMLVGGTDVFMLLGLILLWQMSNSWQMSQIHIPLNQPLAIAAFGCLLMGVFAKAGAMPFHTWIPDMAENAPLPIVAYLPAALDKLLGIYFLMRMTQEMFVMTPAMNTFLMACGAVTIVAAVMMALVQHDFKRLLGYHAVSQVGYMILGIGSGNPIGMAGGLFHMLNNTIYKSCLFLSCGAVEQKTGTTDLDKLGGLAKVMPLNFAAFLIAAFAISGIPPMNGFASKWMIYQGVIETAKTQGNLWIVWLAAAMLGSALTLASFMKLIHAVFLGQPAVDRIPKSDARSEPAPALLVPILILAGLCVTFGVFAYAVPLKLFIFPSLKDPVVFSGIWQAGQATALILLGLFIGFLIYRFGKMSGVRETEVFIGGENLKNAPQMRLSGTEFYNTIQEVAGIRTLYAWAQKKRFDIYEMGEAALTIISQAFRGLHNGVLSSYLAWCLLGLGLLFCFILR